MTGQDIRCQVCGCRVLADRMRWCSSCREWSHLSCVARNDRRCGCGAIGLRYVERRRRRVVPEPVAVVEELTLLDGLQPDPVPSPAVRFCDRWGDVTQRSEPMPECGAGVEVWAAWYEACGCEVCRAVAVELAGPQLAGAR